MIAILTNELDPDTAREYLLNSLNPGESSDDVDSFEDLNEGAQEPEATSDHLVKDGLELVSTTVKLIHKLCLWC